MFSGSSVFKLFAMPSSFSQRRQREWQLQFDRCLKSFWWERTRLSPMVIHHPYSWRIFLPTIFGIESTQRRLSIIDSSLFLVDYRQSLPWCTLLNRLYSLSTFDHGPFTVLDALRVTSIRGELCSEPTWNSLFHQRVHLNATRCP